MKLQHTNFHLNHTLTSCFLESLCLLYRHKYFHKTLTFLCFYPVPVTSNFKQQEFIKKECVLDGWNLMKFLVVIS